MGKKKKLLLLIVIPVVIAVLVVFYQIYRGTQVTPGVVSETSPPVFTPAHSDKAEVRTVTDWYEAVGTVRPRTETRIEAQVAAQVKRVQIKPGDRVSRDQILISLDSRQFSSRLDQAKQAAVAAKAAFTRAEADYNRTQHYFKSHAATAQDMEKAEEILTGARADVLRAEEVVREAQIALGYTTIRAPDAGKVLKRLVEPGDRAAPGKTLLMLETSGMFRLEAHVREGLIKKVAPQTKLKVSIDALGKITEASVEEIIPYADPKTRTFLVKVSLPEMDGIYPGMFGKLLVPVQDHQVVVIPSEAVRRIGQLELVSVKENDTWETRYVKTGKSLGDDVEILSGLSGGETIGY
jgi:RND family efflux transporter MFP subunit